MKVVDDFAEVPPFELLAPPEPSNPFVFNAPHSGTTYPRDLLRRARLDRHAIRRSEDTDVDALFDMVPDLGAPLLKANFPRVYLDLNRAANELDPTMFDGPLKGSVAADSPRVAGGLGVIAKLVGDRQEIYAAPLPAHEAHKRVETFYKPYHATLRDLLAETVERFGAAVLVDCHSMPSGAVKASGPAQPARPDIILGDRFGSSCAPELTEIFADELRRAGLVVGRNRPYAGGYITEHYGRPPHIHAIQLEINRALYMDEATYQRTSGFKQLKARLSDVSARVIERFGGAQMDRRWPVAAE